jgi:hypothetical protein
MRRASDLNEWLSLVEDIFEQGKALFREARIPVTEKGSADPKVIGLLMLARAMSHLRAMETLLRGSMLVEARTIVRNIFELSFRAASLSKETDKFIKALGAEHTHALKFIAQFALKQRGALTPEQEIAMRNEMRALNQRDSAMLNPKTLANDGPLKLSYAQYYMLSLDAHASLHSLDRYLIKPHLGIDVRPKLTQEMDIETRMWACEAAIGVFVGVNDLCKVMTVDAELRKIIDRFCQMSGIEAKASLT